MKPNEQIILNMVAPYIVESSITYDQFDNIFPMLSRTEQYAVVDVLADYNIQLRDAEDSLDTACTAGFADGTDIQGEKPQYDNRIFGGNDPEDAARLRDNHASMSNELLAKAAREGDDEAMEMLFIQNRKLVMMYAVRYTGVYGNSLTTEELESAGKIGFLKAVKHFDYSLGYAFSTYAVWWIRQAIFREIEDHGYTIRIPAHMFEKILKVTKAENELIRKGISSRDMVSSIAETLNATKMVVNEEQVRECQRLRDQMLRCTSLDMAIGENRDSVLGDIVPADTKENPEVVLDRICLKADLMELLRTLSPKEEQVIRLRFGLDDGYTRTLEEVGKEFNVTRERIRQIEAKALKKLRNPSRSYKLEDWLEVA